MLPDDVVGLLERDAEAADLELGKGRHEVLDAGILGGGAEAIVAAGDDTEETAVGAAVLGDAYGGVSRPAAQGEDLAKGSIGADIGVAGDEARLKLLHAAYHLGLLCDGLRAEDKGEPPVACQLYGQRVVGYRLHDRRDEGDVESDA